MVLVKGKLGKSWIRGETAVKVEKLRIKEKREIREPNRENEGYDHGK